jgi:hypothetical protein
MVSDGLQEPGQRINSAKEFKTYFEWIATGLRDSPIERQSLLGALVRRN